MKCCITFVIWFIIPQKYIDVAFIVALLIFHCIFVALFQC